VPPRSLSRRVTGQRASCWTSSIPRLATLEKGSPTATNAIDQLFSGMATGEHALATLRNEVGTGHGRSTPPEGLRPRHGQLAIDTADNTHVRYLVHTLRDLKLI